VPLSRAKNIAADRRAISQSRKYSGSRNSELTARTLIVSRRQAIPKSAIPAYITSLIRHFEDLRDGTHGGSASRKDKEAHFEKELQLLAPIARQVLTEMNTSLLLDTGQLSETGLRRTADGGLNASWALSWPEQRAAGVPPIVLQAYFGSGFHHPHLRGTTVHDWPLNVFSDEDAAAQLSILRAIASSDLHNLVYRADYRIVPVVNRTASSRS
jgi:hypothetical protein